MARLAFVTVGSFGDVNPFVALAREARRRGHEALLAAPAFFGAHVRGAGVDHVPLGEPHDLGAWIRDRRLMHGLASGRRVIDLLLDEAPRAVADLRRALATFVPDVVIGHRVTWGARWVAQERDAPYVNVDLAPMLWFSRADPVPAGQLAPGALHRALARALHAPLWAWSRRSIDARLRRLATAIGARPERSPWAADTERAAATLGLWSPAFRGPMPDDPPRARICGFAFHDDRADAAEAADVDRFLDAGDPPIVFALGSTAVFAAGEFYADAVEACALLRRRGLLLVGPSENVPAGLPASIAAFGYAPYSTVFPRAAAVVVHGGIGSTAQALRAGVPTLVVPFAHDQFNNGVRVEALGVGGVLWKSRLDASRLARALEPLVRDPAMRERACALGAAIRAEEGERTALDTIERALGSPDMIAAGNRVGDS